MFNRIIQNYDYNAKRADLLEKTIALLERDPRPIPGPGTKVRQKAAPPVMGFNRNGWHAIPRPKTGYEGEVTYITDVTVRRLDKVPCFNVLYATLNQAWDPYEPEDCVGEINDIKPMILAMARRDLAQMKR